MARLRSRHVAGCSTSARRRGAHRTWSSSTSRGPTSPQVCEARGRLPVTEAVDYIMQGLDAVAEAHVNGVVHRDLKPSNMFVAEEAEGLVLKVLDFGISKESGDLLGPDAKLTQSQTIIGSPLYMSPEQIRSSRSVDVRSDLWSFGVILYELLAGRTPFTGETMGELFACILEVDFPPLPFLRPDVPAPLAEACIAACAGRSSGAFKTRASSRGRSRPTRRRGSAARREHHGDGAQRPHAAGLADGVRCVKRARRAACTRP